MGLAFVFVKQQQAPPQCGNLNTFVPLKIHVKSVYVKTQKTVILTISKSLNVDFCDSKQ